jgi:hypothetical protein
MDCYPEKSFSGLDSGETWNGWACPLFPLEEAKKIMDLQEDFVSEAKIGGWDVYSINYDSDKEVFTMNWMVGDLIESSEVINPKVIDGVKYYPIGSCNWCWYEKEVA